jgi:DNA mismatch repair protein MutH
MKPTMKELQSRITQHIGGPIVSPITRNKGATGLLLETLTGIPHTSDALDCSDGELKVCPLKKLKNGTIVPKETIAVTMLSRDALRLETFEESKCYAKLRRMLIVPYLRDGNTVQFTTPILVDADMPKYTNMFTELRADYDLIRSRYLDGSALSSKTGKYLQNRTKGRGHGSISRAYYLRTAFIKNL